MLLSLFSSCKSYKSCLNSEARARMPFEVTERNVSALEPLYKPWQEPISYREPNLTPGGPAVIRAGRRPSKLPTVRAIRAEVDAWRQGGYGGVSDTSRHLLSYWFQSDHQVAGRDGALVPFRYHWAQREAIETIIYLYEMRGVRNVADLLLEFGGEALADLALGIPPQDDRWAKNCCKIATGGGKTKVMSLAIAWSYFHRAYEPHSTLAQHFVVIAPNLTVYERLKDDFRDERDGSSLFFTDPVIPDEWRPDFQVQVVLQEEPGGASTPGAIYLTNIHRLYAKGDEDVASGKGSGGIFGPPVNRNQALDTGQALRERIASHPSLMILNDEAHHLHDPDLAWNRAIDSLHSDSLTRGHAGIALQVDFTATPKHNDGKPFHHVVCDFPLGEAVDAGIVKVPVLGESPELVVPDDKSMAAHQRYAMHLKLGYQRYEKSYQELSPVRKPILFVMTEDAQSANEIADYLDSDDFPLLKGRVLNIHTKLKGKVKTVKRGGREIKEFIEDEKGMKPDDLRALREMSRDLDSADSHYRCVVSVMMLREGWDVRNVTTIVPLRAYSAKSGILPEQTLGRGLRRMFPAGDIAAELVTVVHHPAFRKLYEEELAQEGLDIAVMPVRDVFKQSTTIFVDYENKPVADLDITLPSLTDAVDTTTELQGLTIDEVQDYFDDHYKVLPIGTKRTTPIEYKERHLFTDEIVAQMQLDAGLLGNGWSAPSYFAQMLGRACHVSNAAQALTPLVEDFLSRVLFEREVNLYNGEVDHRMRDVDVAEHVRATFTPLILQKTVTKKARQRGGESRPLSAWQPYQATSSDKRPAVQAKSTLFNLVPCDNAFEQEFADFCDYASDVVAFAKNAGPQKFTLDYLRPDGHRALYTPDFFTRRADGRMYLVELKGREDPLVPVKARAAVEWCKTASHAKQKWEYLYVPYYLFQQSPASAIEELARACAPALRDLVREADTGQQALALEEAQARQEAETLYQVILKRAGLTQAPEAVAETMQQVVQLLDGAIRKKAPDYAYAFQPLLGPLDDYAVALLSRYLAPRVPKDHSEQEEYFEPRLDHLRRGEQNRLQKNGRYLKENLVYGRSIQRLGTLLACLTYAAEADRRVDGVWRDVRKVFGTASMLKLCADLNPVNDFRNTRVAHVEMKLTDEKEAWDNLVLWFRCLAQMVALAAPVERQPSTTTRS